MLKLKFWEGLKFANFPFAAWAILYIAFGRQNLTISELRTKYILRKVLKRAIEW